MNTETVTKKVGRKEIKADLIHGTAVSKASVRREKFYTKEDVDRYNNTTKAFWILADVTLAKNWLEANYEKQRGLKLHAVTKYKNRMVKGLWRPTGQPLIFSPEGKLLNGQQRLTALTLADQIVPGIKILFYCVQGIPEEMYQFMDEAVKRTPADALKGEGISSYHDIARVVRLYSAMKYMSEQKVYLQSIPTLDTTTIMDVWKEMEYGDEDYAESLRLRKGFPLINRNNFAACRYLHTELNPEKAREFYHMLSTGAGIPEGSPILLLKNKFAQFASSKSGAKAPVITQLATINMAWNAFIKGKSPNTLVFHKEKAKKFPHAISSFEKSA